MTITLTEGQRALLTRQLEGGRFTSASDVIDHALAVLEEVEPSRPAVKQGTIQRVLQFGERKRRALTGISIGDLVAESQY